MIRTERQRRIDRLSDRHTVRELAGQVVSLTDLMEGANKELGIARRILFQISRKEFTSQGAQEEARKALKEMFQSD